MPGGKIAFYWGILTKLQLTDDEVAMVMGHEMTHALREHGARADRQAGGHAGHDRAAGRACSAGATRAARSAGMGGRLLSLKYSRDDETEADLIGLELAARAGYDPQRRDLAVAQDGGGEPRARRRPSCPTIRPTRTACA